MSLSWTGDPNDFVGAPLPANPPGTVTTDNFEGYKTSVGPVEVLARINAAQTWTATQTFRPAAASGVGQIVQGLTSQSADLQQWQDSAGTVLARVQSNGTVVAEADLSVNGAMLVRTGWLGASLNTRAMSSSAPAAIYKAVGAPMTGALVQYTNETNGVMSSVTGTGEYENAVAGAGIILKSPNGTRYRVTVADGGALTTTAA